MDISKENEELRKIFNKDLTDLLIRLAVVGLVVFVSFKIFNPFMGIMLWALVLAVTLYPMHQKLSAKLGGSHGKASTIIVLVGAILIGGPVVLAGLADNVLKPLLLGRGVDAPMPVVLLGALGGAISGGLLGLFIGAVFLSLAYVIFMTWVDAGLKDAPYQTNMLNADESA